MSAHAAVVRDFPDGVGISCDCGWIDPYLWSETTGARNAFLTHIVTAHFPAEWPGAFFVDYDPDGRMS